MRVRPDLVFDMKSYQSAVNEWAKLGNTNHEEEVEDF